MALAFLLNAYVERGGVRLLFKGECGRFSIRDRYEPYFYIICRNPDETRWLISQHPSVTRASIEERFQDLRSREKAPLVRVQCGLGDFREVVQDARKLEGISEIAETSVPHYYRYVMDNGLKFFGAYELSGGKFRPAGSEALPELDCALWRGGPIPDADVVFTDGGDYSLRGARGVLQSTLGCFLPESLHIDLRQDRDHDIYNEGGSAGPEDDARLMAAGRERLIRIIELSQISGAKPDLIPRISPGKLNCYLHMSAARKAGHIVPDIRKSVERPKSMKLLKKMDRGGTIIYPKPGIFRNVAKCDFSSLYPSIIVNCNISPETMHCGCGDDAIVPETGWRICRRRGLIPEGLEPVLRRRLELKAEMRASSGEQRKKCDIRQKALKNILVTCFGYMGYSNFVFSNVETKECVMHYGRVIMERTKDIADSMGLDVLYGYVDSIFVAGGSRDDYSEFMRAAGAEFGIELALDCTFDSVAFPRGAAGCAAANHYYGITDSGEIEARGIAYRHSDAPLFIKRYQGEAMRAFLGNDSGGFEAAYEKCRAGLLGREFPLDELKIARRLRKESYKAAQPHVRAYMQSHDKSGFVEFVYTAYGPKPMELARIEEIDAGKYLALLARARKELVNF
ncbi:MAG TPA: DNA polymerase domain-containing protein [Candidatus Bilamarchaeum sp.]|nr:DNA polymerase domain-containing protein [Candidatus Bilamarchaeum sp.]